MKNFILVTLILGMSLLSCEIIAPVEDIKVTSGKIKAGPHDPPQHGDCPDNTNPGCPEYIPPIIF